MNAMAVDVFELVMMVANERELGLVFLAVPLAYVVATGCEHIPRVSMSSKSCESK
jgi:hypothetical protein